MCIPAISTKAPVCNVMATHWPCWFQGLSESSTGCRQRSCWSMKGDVEVICVHSLTPKLYAELLKVVSVDGTGIKVLVRRGEAAFSGARRFLDHTCRDEGFRMNVHDHFLWLP